jgi:hypothetical protein
MTNSRTTKSPEGFLDGRWETLAWDVDYYRQKPFKRRSCKHNLGWIKEQKDVGLFEDILKTSLFEVTILGD